MAIVLAHRTRGIVWQNIILAMTVKAVLIALGATGSASLWTVVFADVSVELLAVLNAGRIIKIQVS